jgi:hypothetical protein
MVVNIWQNPSPHCKMTTVQTFKESDERIN